MFKYWHPTPWALHIPAFELGSRILQLFQIKNILEKGRKQHLNLAKKSNFPGEQKNVSSLTAHSFEIFNITSDNIVFLTNRRRGVLNFRLP